ncbi:MAG: hypothetical protein ABF751_00045 [Acetobacter orientalis]|uniref:hypothetical protein n=1 Tax=Acetobacter TaxID=434 RepID=UPI0039E8BD69
MFEQAAGNAERMTMRQIIDALAVAPSAFTGTRPVGVKKTYLRQVARAVMQMWGDLESEEQKALA